MNKSIIKAQLTAIEKRKEIFDLITNDVFSNCKSISCFQCPAFLDVENGKTLCTYSEILKLLEKIY